MRPSTRWRLESIFLAGPLVIGGAVALGFALFSLFPFETLVAVLLICLAALVLFVTEVRRHPRGGAVFQKNGRHGGP